MAEEFVDISGWQGVINWDAHYAAGYRRASIKATEGNGFTDPQFSRNASETGRLGMQRIFYGYARPDLGNSPEAEADWLWQMVAPYFKPDDALECDLEAGSPSQDWLNRYVARLQTHAGAGTYSGNWFMAPRGLTYVGFSHVASYGSVAPQADIWQYTDVGSVPGISGGVDLNRVLNPAALAATGVIDMWNDNDEKMLQAIHQTVQGGLLPVLVQIGQLPAIKAELDTIKAAIDSAGGHPADAPILAAVGRAQAQLDAIAAKVNKDLA